MLEFINRFEKYYSPFKDAKTSTDKVNKLMITFAEIMDTMNEKKSLLITAHPDREREVMEKLTFTPIVGLGKLIIQKKMGYSIIRTREQIIAKGKEMVGSTSTAMTRGFQLEERPEEPMPKR